MSLENVTTEDYDDAFYLSNQVEQAKRRAVLAASDAGVARDRAASAEQSANEAAKRAQRAAQETSSAPQDAAEAKAAATEAVEAKVAAVTAKADAEAAAATSATAAAAAKQEAIADATTKYGGLPQRLTAVELKNTQQDTAIAAANPKRGAVPDGNLDELTIPGEYYLSNVKHNSHPFPGKFAFVKVQDYLPFGTGRLVEVTTWENVPRKAKRVYNGVWQPWDYMPNSNDLASLTARIDSVSEESKRPSSGTKVVPLAITAAQGPWKDISTDGSARWVRKWSVAPTRIRIHISNRNPGQGTLGTTVSLNGIWAGKGDASGNVTDSTQVLGQLPLLGSGVELVTPWFRNPAGDGEFLAITTAWFAMEGSEIVRMQGGGWVHPDNAARFDTGVVGWTRVKETPFHVWVEAEVPATTPVICGHGDSITIGTAATDPVGDSYVAVYAYEQGALPVILAEHGSSMAGWNLSVLRWDQYPGIKLPEIVDVTVTTMGQNDLAKAGITVAELKSLHETMMPILRKNVGGVIYTGLLTPSNKTTDLEVIRKEYNSWLATLPTGTRGVIDFATAVGTADGEALAPEYSADGLHPNTAGHQAMANKVMESPVTPYTLPPSKLKALASLL